MTLPPELSCRPSEYPHRGGWVAVAFVFAGPAVVVGFFVGLAVGWWTA